MSAHSRVDDFFHNKFHLNRSRRNTNRHNAIMKKYKFYQDKKVSVWERSFFSVEAESYDQALGKVENLKLEEINKSLLDDLEIFQGIFYYYDRVEVKKHIDNISFDHLRFFTSIKSVPEASETSVANAWESIYIK